MLRFFSLFFLPLFLASAAPTAATGSSPAPTPRGCCDKKQCTQGLTACFLPFLASCTQRICPGTHQRPAYKRASANIPQFSHDIPRQFAVPDPSTGDKWREGKSQIYFHYHNARNGFQLATTPEGGETSIMEMLVNSAQKFGDERTIAGYRQLLDTHQVDLPGGKKAEKLELDNQYTWVTWGEYMRQVFSFAGGLREILRQKSEEHHGAPKPRVLIYAETQMGWLNTAFGAMAEGLTIVTAYATLGAEATKYAINQTKASIIIVDAKLAKTVSDIIADCPSVEYVLTIGELEEKFLPIKQKLQRPDHVKQVLSVEDVRWMGRSNTSNRDYVRSSPDDIAVIMYTSGTTGNPKGVTIAQKNIAALLAAVERLVGIFVNSDPTLPAEDTFMAYLPLAHILELATELICTYKGIRLAYGNPHTLVKTGIKLYEKSRGEDSKGDVTLAQPTVFLAPPAVLEKVQAGIKQKMADDSTVNRFFHQGLRIGAQNLERGLIGSSEFFDKLIFSKVQESFGGKVKVMITGSAPVSKDMLSFFQTVMNCPVRQGYGATETMGVSTVAEADDPDVGVVGPPALGSVIRLVDWEEGGYRISDISKEGVMAMRGEVWIGGPQVTMGYFIPEKGDHALEAKNKEDFADEDGYRWFKTGDVGKLGPEGTLTIVDRKKDLWKGPQGEYVSLTNVENHIKNNQDPYAIDQIMMYGKTGGSYPIAIVVPNKRAVFQHIGQEVHDMSEEDKDALLGEILASTDSIRIDVGSGVDVIRPSVADGVKQWIEQIIRKACDKARLAPFEKPSKFIFSHEPWTPENELLTAQQKLKKPAIQAKFQAEINALYDSLPAP